MSSYNDYKRKALENPDVRNQKSLSWNGKTAGKWPWHEIEDRIHPGKHNKDRQINWYTK